MRHKFPVLTVKKWLKSVYIYESYRKNKIGVPFFGPPLYRLEVALDRTSLAARCPFFSGRVRLWRRFLRLCWVSDFGVNSSSSTWYAQCRTFPNSLSSASSTSSSAVVADSHRPDRAARRRDVSMRWRSVDVEILLLVVVVTASI